MNNLKLASIIDKNKVASSDPWPAFLTIAFQDQVIRLVNVNQDQTYKGNVYTAFGFTLDIEEISATGELSKLVLKVSNVNRLIESELQKFNGGTDAIVQINFVSLGNLSGDPELEAMYKIISTSSDANWVTFTLGADNPLMALVPKQIYTVGYCWKVFNTPDMQADMDDRGWPCDYQGSDQTCSHLLFGDNGCISKNNEKNFGGFPGLDSSGFRRALNQ